MSGHAYGTVREMAQACEKPEILYAQIDLNRVDGVRKKIPALHRRPEHGTPSCVHRGPGASVRGRSSSRLRPYSSCPMLPAAVRRTQAESEGVTLPSFLQTRL